MRKQDFKTIRLFLKLIILFQIYSYHRFTADAFENDISENLDECKISTGTDFKDQIPKKETEENVLIERPKRPARLLPLKMILGKESNQTEIESMRFYGPASSCEELLKIGYTRNGFYLVQGNTTSNSSHVELVECLFKNPKGIKEVKEKRFGFVPLKNITSRFRQRRFIDNLEIADVVAADETFLERQIRPVRLLPSYLFNEQDKNETKEQITVQRFYGPPGNCSELGKLGYTLNGYYLVNGSKSSRQIEIVLCRFKLPPGENNNAFEDRLGFISLDQIAPITDQSQLATMEKLGEIGKEANNNKIIARNLRPARILPNRLLKKENETEVQRPYSNPFSCYDIGMLGYTLNGYYLVNGSNSIVQRFGVVFCQFRLPPGATKIFEEKLGFINLFDKHTINEAQGLKQFGSLTRDVTTSTTSTTTEDSDYYDSSEMIDTTITLNNLPTHQDLAVFGNEMNPTQPTKSHTTEDSDYKSSEIIDTTATSTIATKKLTNFNSAVITTQTTKSPLSCSRHNEQSYHLQNNEKYATCLALEHKGGTNRVVRLNCNNNDRSEMQWTKRVSQYDISIVGDTFRLCSSSNEMKCLSVSQISTSKDYIINVKSFLDDGSTNMRYQQWRQNPKTNQLANVETGTCLTSFDSKPLSNTLADRLLPVGLKICTRGANVTMKQKWLFTPLPKC